jgi:octaprenyl-diphosphate synthase
LSQIADQPESVTWQLADLYAPVAEALAQVESILRREMRSKYACVDELVRYGCLLGGKRLRPALLLLSAQCVGPIRSQHLTLAAVLEMIHTASLVHDDVLDHASLRRHLATVNTRWDNEASVLLGDFLFSHAFYLASTLDSPSACQAIGRATNIVCEGEMRQKGSQAEFSMDEATYLQILDAKTAELCACCCELGARFGNAPASTIQQLA